MRNFLNIIATISILLFIFTTIVVFYWLNHSYKPLVFQDKEFPVWEKVIKRGDILHYTSNYCKYMDLPALVTRTFVNEILFVTPTTITNRPMGCNTLIVAVAIPKELPAGKFRIEMTYQFQVNPIRKITVKENTVEFEVIDATPSGTINM